MTTKLFVCAMALAGGISTAAFAQQDMATGVVTAVNEKAGTISVQHGKLGTVGSGTADTAEEFKVADGLMFNALKPGDKIRFTVDQVNGGKIVTKVEKQ